jgi:amidohydrolase
MASVDGFAIDVIGKGGHSAVPHQAVDAVLIAAQITVALQTIVSRNVDPLIPAVISVTRIITDKADNVIAEKATLRGLARTFDPAMRDMLKDRIRDLASGIAKGMGASIDFKWTSMYPPTINDEKSAALVRQAATDVLGGEEKIVLERTMASEDMAYYLEKIPGCFFFLGCANPEKGLDKAHHNPRFDFDEAALPLGVALFARLAQVYYEKAHPKNT